MSRIDPGFGLVLLDERIALDTLTATGVGTRDSAYTATAPVPGVAEVEDGSTWRPQVSRAQSVDLTLRTLRGGYAGAEGAEVVYRLATDADDEDYRSWTDPNLITGWTASASSLASSDLWGGGGQLFDSIAACVTSAGVIVVVAVEPGGGGRCYSYDTRSGAWTTRYAFASLGPGLVRPIGLAYDPDADRVLLYLGTDSSGGLRQAALYSDDLGDTWAEYSRRSLGGSTISGADDGAIRVAVRPGSLDWLAFVLDETDGSGEATQFASPDRGSSFDLVDVCSAANTGHYPVWTGSHFVVAYVNASGSPCVRVLASARASFDSAAEVEVDGTRDASYVVPVVDDDGVVYLYAGLDSGGTPTATLAAYRSIDGGITWERYLSDVYTDTSTTEWYEWSVGVASAGCVFLLGLGIGNSSTDHTVSLLRLGGWSTLGQGLGALGSVLGHERRMGWGSSVSGTSLEGRSWIPVGNPTGHGWSVLSAAGTLALTHATHDAGYFNLAAGNPLEWRFTCSGTAKSSCAAEIEAIVHTAETVANAIASITRNAHLTLRVSDGSTYEYEVALHLCSDGAFLQDQNGLGTVDQVALTMNGTVGSVRTWTRFRILVTTARVDWWYQQGGNDHDPIWHPLGGGALTNGAAATQSRAEWGCSAAIATTTLAIRRVGVQFGGAWTEGGSDDLADLALGYSDAGIRAHLHSKPIPGRATPYPIPELTAASEAIGLLAATGGPSRAGDLVELPTAYTHPIDAVYPTVSPSPRDGWVATDTSEVKLVHDLTDARWFGDGLALLVIGARPYEWILETDDASTGWTVQGTLDLSFASSLTFSRTGRILVASGGSAPAAYLRENELAGGYVISGGVAAEITGNAAGFWGGVRQRTRLELTEIGSFPASGSDLRIVRPSGLLVVYAAAFLGRRYVRIRAASGATVPGDAYRAGILAVGRVVGVGADPAWSWSVDHVSSTRRSRSSDGVSHVREIGPTRRRVTYAWPDFADTAILREGTDYIAASAGIPIGTAEDAATLPELLEVIRSGEVPVVVVPRLPTSSGSLLARESWIYGRVTVDSLAVTGKLGTEGTSEVVTVGGLTVDELR